MYEAESNPATLSKRQSPPRQSLGFAGVQQTAPVAARASKTAELPKRVIAFFGRVIPMGSPQKHYKYLQLAHRLFF